MSAGNMCLHYDGNLKALRIIFCSADKVVVAEIERYTFSISPCKHDPLSCTLYIAHKTIRKEEDVHLSQECAK